MRFVTLSVPLVLTVADEEGTALGIFYEETAPASADASRLAYLVSFSGEAAPRIVDQSEVTAHRVGRA